jgi:hypothetical protein
LGERDDVEEPLLLVASISIRISSATTGTPASRIWFQLTPKSFHSRQDGAHQVARHLRGRSDVREHE